MDLNKHLYYLRLSPQNELNEVQNSMDAVLLAEDQSFTLEPRTHFVYTSRPRNEMVELIGLGLPSLRGFILIELDLESAMSTFTDNRLLIDFLLMVKDSLPNKVTQSDIDAILDKISKHGKISLNREDIVKLRLFGLTTGPA